MSEVPHVFWNLAEREVVRTEQGYLGNRHLVGPYSRTMPRLLWRS